MDLITESLGIMMYRDEEKPWRPLNDGYSNFWFELTDDTLSPWLNFSAKNNDAVIDWGDGSGEVALDTLTPTHTYEKAGRYIVKVKGVTGIDRLYRPPYTDYCNIIRHVELSSEVTSLISYTFLMCNKIENFVIHSQSYSVGAGCFQVCTSLENIDLTNATVIPNNVCSNCSNIKSVFLPCVASIGEGGFYYCSSLAKITIPSSVTSIGTNAFILVHSLSEIHCQATTPPTLNGNVFSNLPSNYVIYVPVGYGDTYKAASGWSTYADHITEDGSQLSVSQLRNIELENSKKSDDGDMR